MIGTVGDLEPVVAPESERPKLMKLEKFFRERRPLAVKLVGPDGEEIDLPDSALQLLHRSIPLLAEGKAITLVPRHKELTTQEAAEVLNMSRSYLLRLLAANEIPYVMVGTHRRIRLDDLMRYKERRDAERREALDRLTAMSQEFGPYTCD